LDLYTLTVALWASVGIDIQNNCSTDDEDEGAGSATKKLRRTVIDDGFQSTTRLELAVGVQALPS
jgi:hypothetical protein